MPSGLRRVHICVGEKDAYVRQRDVFSDYDVIFDWHGLRRDEETITQRWLPTESVGGDYGGCQVQLSSRWYLCVRKSPYALHPVSQKFHQCCL